MGCLDRREAWGAMYEAADQLFLVQQSEAIPRQLTPPHISCAGRERDASSGSRGPIASIVTRTVDKHVQGVWKGTYDMIPGAYAR